MRYISTNKDGSVALWATVPLKIIQNSDKTELQVFGVRRKESGTFLYGSFPSGDGFELRVGDKDFDVSDMPSDLLEGFTIVFPDFEKDILAKLAPETQAQYASYRILDRSEILEDRTFRAAWQDTGKVSVHMGKAREIHKNTLRILRQPLLDQLDIDYIKADEEGLTSETPNVNLKKKKDIMARKQELRDITKHPDIENAKTPDELKEAGKSLL